MTHVPFVLCSFIAEEAEIKTKKNDKKEKRKAAFGWDVFNQVSLLLFFLLLNCLIACGYGSLISIACWHCLAY